MAEILESEEVLARGVAWLAARDEGWRWSPPAARCRP